MKKNSSSTEAIAFNNISPLNLSTEHHHSLLRIATHRGGEPYITLEDAMVGKNGELSQLDYFHITKDELPKVLAWLEKASGAIHNPPPVPAPGEGYRFVTEADIGFAVEVSDYLQCWHELRTLKKIHQRYLPYETDLGFWRHARIKIDAKIKYRDPVLPDDLGKNAEFRSLNSESDGVWRPGKLNGYVGVVHGSGGHKYTKGYWRSKNGGEHEYCRIKEVFDELGNIVKDSG